MEYEETVFHVHEATTLIEAVKKMDGRHQMYYFRKLTMISYRMPSNKIKDTRDASIQRIDRKA